MKSKSGYRNWIDKTPFCVSAKKQQRNVVIPDWTHKQPTVAKHVWVM